jgi:hypothetical protein
MRNVYRGIYGANFVTPPMYSAGNTVTLAVDPTANPQWGINFSSCSNGTITTNNVLGPNTTNTTIDGIYAALNNTLTVTCNTVGTTYQGFQFSNSNPGTIWKGNSMQNHIRGMILNYTATIGQQGSAGNPMDNAWNGTWTSGTNYQTWTDNGTFATGSPLYTRSVTPYFMPPLLNNGNPTSNSYNVCCTNTTTGSYSCGGGGGNLMGGGEEEEQMASMKLLEDIAGYETETKDGFSACNFIAQYQLYRTLENNPVLQTSSKTLGDFYTDNKTKSYGKLSDAEIDLANGNYSAASSALSSISAKNNIETNYESFYNLYAKYYTKVYTDNENTALLSLANKCPFLEGEVIYQARALYNVINSTVGSFKDNCPGDEQSSSRLANNNLSSVDIWNASIYPNPASNELFISSTKEIEQIKVIITDVNGRTIADYFVKTNGFAANMKLSIDSGIYFVTLSNSNGEKVVKKLVVTK